MPFSTSNGIRIHYQVQGEGPWMVLIHANPFDHRLWMAQAARLSAFYRVVSLDLRGYGRSDKPETPFSLADMAGDVLGVCDDLGIDHAVVAGVSVGSGIALWLGQNHPERVRALVLVGGSSAGGGNIGKRIAGYTGADPAAYRRAHMAELFAPGYAETPEGQWVIAMFAETSPALSGACIGRIFEARRDCDMTGGLEAMTMPVLVMNGAHDVSLAAGRATAAGIPGARHVVIPDAGHACCIETPARFDPPFFAFLADHGLWPGLSIPAAPAAAVQGAGSSR